MKPDEWRKWDDEKVLGLKNKSSGEGAFEVLFAEVLSYGIIQIFNQVIHIFNAHTEADEGIW